MIGTPVPKARNANRRIAHFLLFTTNLVHRRSLGRIRSKLRKAGEIIEVRHVTRHHKEVKHIQCSRIILFTRDRFATALCRCTADLFFEDFINRTEISLCRIAINGRSSEAETTGERRRNESAFIAVIQFILSIDVLVARIHSTCCAGFRNKPVSHIFIELFGIAIAIPVVGPSGAPRRTSGIIIKANIVRNSSTSQFRLMIVPVTPVRHKPRLGILAGEQILHRL